MCNQRDDIRPGRLLFHLMVEQKARSLAKTSEAFCPTMTAPRHELMVETSVSGLTGNILLPETYTKP